MSYGRRKPKPPIYDAETGVPPTAKQIEKMTNQSWNVSIYALSQGDKTTHEIVEKLKKKKIIDEIIEETIHKLTDAGYLDDRDYAFQFVERKQRSLGAKQIEWKLRNKGIDADLIEEAMGELDEETSYQAALKVAESRVRSTRRVEDKYKRKQSISAAVMRQGFSSSIAFQVTDLALENEANDQFS